MLASLVLNQNGLAKVLRLAKVDSDRQLSELIGVDVATVCRVRTGKSAPGAKFIAGLMDAFGTEWFADLFDVHPENEQQVSA